MSAKQSYPLPYDDSTRQGGVGARRIEEGTSAKVYQGGVGARGEVAVESGRRSPGFVQPGDSHMMENIF